MVSLPHNDRGGLANQLFARLAGLGREAILGLTAMPSQA
jgi:hypothetical protein